MNELVSIPLTLLEPTVNLFAQTRQILAAKFGDYLFNGFNITKPSQISKIQRQLLRDVLKNMKEQM